jgi:hypothetical protein
VTGTAVDVVELAGVEVDRIAILDRHGALWITFAAPWWDAPRWLWWWLSPGRRAWLQVAREGRTARVRAVRVARRVFRIGGGS